MTGCLRAYIWPYTWLDDYKEVLIAAEQNYDAVATRMQATAALYGSLQLHMKTLAWYGVTIGYDNFHADAERDGTRLQVQVLELKRLAESLPLHDSETFSIARRNLVTMLSKNLTAYRIVPEGEADVNDFFSYPSFSCGLTCK
jgi:hypothetical protein